MSRRLCGCHSRFSCEKTHQRQHQRSLQQLSVKHRTWWDQHVRPWGCVFVIVAIQTVDSKHTATSENIPELLVKHWSNQNTTYMILYNVYLWLLQKDTWVRRPIGETKAPVLLVKQCTWLDGHIRPWICFFLPVIIHVVYTNLTGMTRKLY